MQIERIRPTQFRLTLHAYDLATLITSARWVASGARGELSDEAKKQLVDFLGRYDTAFEHAGAGVAGTNGGAPNAEAPSE